MLRVVMSCALLVTGSMATTVVRAERPKPRLVEESIETTADLISMPGTAGGLLTVRGCASCASQALRLASGFQFLVGGRAVAVSVYADRLKALGSTPATVHYTISDQLVTRITAAGL